VNSLSEDFSATDSGIGFIYSALESLAKRYTISDAAVVLVNESFGTQMFRLYGRSVSADLVDKFGSHPGVYCTPDAVPQDELDAVYEACQRSFSSQSVRFNTARIASNPQEGPRDESEVREPPHRSHDKLEAPMATTNHHAFSSRRIAASLRGKTNRALLSRFLALVDVAVFIMTVSGIHGPMRLVLGLVLGLVIPGWCVVGLLKLDNAPLEFGLTLAVSMSLLMIIAQIMETINLWHPIALEVVTCVICLPLLIFLAGGTMSDRMALWARKFGPSVKWIWSHRR